MSMNGCIHMYIHFLKVTSCEHQVLTVLTCSDVGFFMCYNTHHDLGFLFLSHK